MIQIQNITQKVIVSVDDLAESSNRILNFVMIDVEKDYIKMLEIARNYSEDAVFVDRVMNEYNKTTEGLLVSIHDIFSVVDSVAKAANTGAEGASDISGIMNGVAEKSNEILDLSNKSNEASEELMNEIGKFKI